MIKYEQIYHLFKFMGLGNPRNIFCENSRVDIFLHGTFDISKNVSISVISINTISFKHDNQMKNILKSYLRKYLYLNSVV